MYDKCYMCFVHFASFIWIQTLLRLFKLICMISITCVCTSTSRTWIRMYALNVLLYPPFGPAFAFLSFFFRILNAFPSIFSARFSHLRKVLQFSYLFPFAACLLWPKLNYNYRPARRTTILASNPFITFINGYQYFFGAKR